MSLELKYVKLETLTQDGVVLNYQEEYSDFPLNSNYNSMSERKRLTFSFNNVVDLYDLQSIEGALLYVNFAMFLPKGFVYSEPTGPPNAGFNLRIPSHLSNNERHQMYFFCNGNPATKTNNNYKCTFISAETSDVNMQFYIELEYYNTFDEGTYFNFVDKNNQWRFMAEYFNQLNFSEISDSVYHNLKELRSIIYLQSEVVTKSEYALVDLQANTFNAKSQWTFGDEGYTELNTSKDTDVIVLIKTTSVLTDWHVKIINDKSDASTDFVSNYNIQENKITPSSSDNVFKSPFDYSTVVIDGDSYQRLIFTVDKDFISPENNYRMIGIGYDGYFLTPVVFISPLIQVLKAYPYDGNGIDFTGSISDIQRTFYGDELTCSIDERLSTKIFLDYPYDKYKNDILTRLGVEISNDIRIYMETVTVEIYEEYFDSDLDGIVKNLLETSILRKVGFNSYSGESITGDFYNNGCQFSYTFRNRSDDVGTPIAVTVNGSPYYTLDTGNQYWGGKDIFIKWSFSFVYPGFSDIIDYIQKLHVKDYNNGLLITRTGSDLDYTTPEDTLCYEVELTHAIPEYNTSPFLLINTIKSVVLPILEQEGFAGDELPEQETDYIYDQDVLFSDLTAKYCIETANLVIGQQYVITAIAKKNYTY